MSASRKSKKTQSPRYLSAQNIIWMVGAFLMAAFSYQLILFINRRASHMESSDHFIFNRFMNHEPVQEDVKFSDLVTIAETAEACHHPAFEFSNTDQETAYQVVEDQKDFYFVSQNALSEGQRNRQSAADTRLEQYHQHEIKRLIRVFQEFKTHVTEATAKITIDRLGLALVAAKIAEQTGLLRCGTSVDLSIGKAVAAHLLAKKPLPTLVVVNLNAEHKKRVSQFTRQGKALLDGHVTLLMIDPEHPQDKQIINQLKKTSNIKQQIKMLQNTRSTVFCDAWAKDFAALVSLRAQDNINAQLTANPQLVTSIEVIDASLLANSALQPTLEFVFNQHTALWRRILLGNQFSTAEAKLLQAVAVETAGLIKETTNQEHAFSFSTEQGLMGRATQQTLQRENNIRNALQQKFSQEVYLPILKDLQALSEKNKQVAQYMRSNPRVSETINELFKSRGYAFLMADAKRGTCGAHARVAQTLIEECLPQENFGVVQLSELQECTYTANKKVADEMNDHQSLIMRNHRLDTWLDRENGLYPPNSERWYMKFYHCKKSHLKSINELPADMPEALRSLIHDGLTRLHQYAKTSLKVGYQDLTAACERLKTLGRNTL